MPVARSSARRRSHSMVISTAPAHGATSDPINIAHPSHIGSPTSTAGNVRMNSAGPPAAASFGDRIRHVDAHGTATFSSTRQTADASAPTVTMKYTTASSRYPMASTRPRCTRRRMTRGPGPGGHRLFTRGSDPPRRAPSSLNLLRYKRPRDPRMQRGLDRHRSEPSVSHSMACDLYLNIANMPAKLMGDGRRVVSHSDGMALTALSGDEYHLGEPL